MKKVLMIVNPISGNIDKFPIIKQVQHLLHQKVELCIFTTSGDGDIRLLELRIQEFGPDRLLVVGGDGTIKLAAEAGYKKKMEIGILPMGSANGLATDLDIPKSLEQALQVALGKNLMAVDIIEIADSIGLHISDIGINAELIANFSQNKIRGHFGYFLNTIPTLLRTKAPYKFSVSANNKTLHFKAIMVAIANSKKFGTGTIINPEGKINDGEIEIIIFKKLDIVNILKTIGGEVKLNSDFVEIIKTKEVTIKAERLVDFQIDGEHFGQTSNIYACVKPGAIKIAIP